MVSQRAARAKAVVYVPDHDSGTVDVIDPVSDRVVSHFNVGQGPTTVVPVWALSELFVTNETSATITPVDMLTAMPGKPIPVASPTDLYFTLDGKRALIVSDPQHEVEVREPNTWQLVADIPLPRAKGLGQLDLSADGKVAYLTASSSGTLIPIDLTTLTADAPLDLGGEPSDVLLAPNGRSLYVVNSKLGGVQVIDLASWSITQLIPTSIGASNEYLSRDGRSLYVTDPDGGTVRVVSIAAGIVEQVWKIPHGGSPAAGGVSADGSELWLAGPEDGEVYVLSTVDGQLLDRIPVGAEPTSLTVFPQPGRFALGDTGRYR
jgi:DNA-binding beta-propeller fold protein YncE